MEDKRDAMKMTCDESDRDLDHAVEVLKALSHPVRLRIVRALSSGELCVKHIEELVGCSQSSVSQHLSRLRYAGVIESERRGHLVCYRLSDGSSRRILDVLLEHGRPE